MGPFTVHTCTQNEPQAVKARIIEAFRTEVCHAPETLIHHSISVITLYSPDITSFSCFTLPVSSDLCSRIRGQAGFGIFLSMQAKRALLVWIPFNSHLCTIWLRGSVLVNSGQLKRRCWFISSLYTPTYCNSP